MKHWHAVDWAGKRYLSQDGQRMMRRRQSERCSAAPDPLMKQRAQALLVLGGWPRPDEQGVWRSSLFENGGIGDRLRVEAAALLYQGCRQLIVVAGGKGKLAHLAEAPACASVMKRELLELGVPADDVTEELGSANTYQQLQSIRNLFDQFPIARLRILSNRYHLPRIDAFLSSDAQLSEWFATGRLLLQAAEEILLQRHPERWHDLIADAYASHAMRERIEQEAKGVRDFRAGTYICQSPV